MRILRNALNKILPDNRGASMVTVLVTVAFLVILTSLLLVMSYVGYVVKASHAVGENRFYDAETAMDEVRAGLQGFASDGIAHAFSNVLKSYTGVGDIDKAFAEEFGHVFLATEKAVPSPAPAPPVVTPLFRIPGDDPLDPAPITVLVQQLFSLPPATFSTEIQKVTFELDFLRSFITQPADAPGEIGAWLSVSDPGGVCRVVIKYVEWSGVFLVESITIQGLRVTHISPDGYHSVAESDISFGMPNLSYARSMFAFRGFSDFAFIATGEMNSTGASITVEGSAYFGSINLSGSGSEEFTFPVKLMGGTFISGGDGLINSNNPDANGDVTVVGRELIVDGTASLWARNIIVGAKTGGTTVTDPPTPASNIRGDVSFLGNTYAAGSLVLAGDKSTATLAGRYYGFGMGGDGDYPDPAYSSSILVNSRENKLDLSGLNLLFLAGHSFINANVSDTMGVTVGANVLTGQAMAVKSDQLAYVLPVSHMVGLPANPTVVADGVPDYIERFEDVVPGSQYSILFDAPLWTSGTETRTLSDYINPAIGAGGVPIGIQTVRRTLQIQSSSGSMVDQEIFYVFMKFTDDYPVAGSTAQQNANAYFRDYFAHNARNNPAEVQAYLRLYLSPTRDEAGNITAHDGYFNAASTTSEGITYAIDNRGNFGVTNPTGVYNAERYAEEYENRRKTLTREDVGYNFGTNPENPFHYVVKERPPAGDYLYPDDSGTPRVRAVVSDVDYTFLSDMSDIKIVIVYGDVHIVPGTNFSGLILCDGDIYVNGSIVAGGNALRDALQASNPADGSGKTLGEYLNIDISDVALKSGADEAWDFNELVYYDNWKKR